MLIHTFISNRLDYCNTFFTRLPKKSIEKLQLIQNSAARLLMKTVLATLRWLPVYFRADFIFLLLVGIALSGLAPSYITDSRLFYVLQRALRSSIASLLNIPKVPPQKIGELAFIHYVPKLWNTLPKILNIFLSELVILLEVYFISTEDLWSSARQTIRFLVTSYTKT